MDANKSFCIIDLENCDYIISVECIGSVDETIPLMFLISQINILYKWCQHNDLNGNIVIGTIETSYIINDIALK